jgi:hypothetical protein
MEKDSPARKVRSERRASRIFAAASDRLSALEIIVASRFAGGVLISSMNRGRKAGQKTVVPVVNSIGLTTDAESRNLSVL